MPARIDIVNGALRLLGKKSVSVLTDSDATEINLVVTRLAHEAFATRWWRFATRPVRLVSTGANSNYNYEWIVYGIPVGALRVVDVFRAELDRRYPITYEHDAEGIHTLTYDDIFARCVFELPSEEWTIEFARFMEAAAAWEVSPRLKPGDNQMIEREMIRRKRMAEVSDAADGGRKRRLLNPDGYINARGSGFVDDDGYYNARYPV